MANMLETVLFSPYPEGCLSLPPYSLSSPLLPHLWWKEIQAPHHHLLQFLSLRPHLYDFLTANTLSCCPPHQGVFDPA